MSVVTQGYDTVASINWPDLPHGEQRSFWIHNAVRRAYVYFPLPDLRGKTILSAELTGHCFDDSPGSTPSAFMLDAKWWPNYLTWNNQPNTVGVGCHGTHGPLTDGEAFTIGVQPHLQAVANGQAWYGFRVVTDVADDIKVRSFEAEFVSWVLEYEVSQRPEQPQGLVPDGGFVSTEHPILKWDEGDFGGGSNQAAFRIQIDPLGSALVGQPEFDTGTVLSTEAMFDTDTPLSRSVTYSRTAGSTTITAGGIVAAGEQIFQKSDVGMAFVGAGIPASTVIVSVLQSPNRAVLSKAATASNAAATGTITRLYPGLGEL